MVVVHGVAFQNKKNTNETLIIKGLGALTCLAERSRQVCEYRHTRDPDCSESLHEQT